MTNTDKVLKSLSIGPSTVNDIARENGLNHKQIHAALYNLRRNGLVKKWGGAGSRDYPFIWAKASHVITLRTDQNATMTQNYTHEN